MKYERPRAHDQMTGWENQFYCRVIRLERRARKPLEKRPFRGGAARALSQGATQNGGAYAAAAATRVRRE